MLRRTVFLVAIGVLTVAEHERIRNATEKVRVAAREAKASVHEQFAKDLAQHARTEEEVLYPAAILVGEIVRARMGLT